MALLAELGKKSWLTPDQHEVEYKISGHASGAATKTALKLFMVISSVLFFLFSITYVSRSQFPDFQALAGDPWLPLTHPWRLWLNTAFLVAAGACLELGHRLLLTSKQSLLFAILVFSLLFSVLFVLGQYWVWQDLHLRGFLLTSNPANSYFYVLTGIHSLHLLGGIAVLFKSLFLLAVRSSMSKVRLSLLLCRWYWHFLLLLWIYLFWLLSAPASAYKAIAALCGL